MRPDRARRRGMTMIEVVVAIGVLAMVAVLVHGVINSLSHGKEAEAQRADRVHQGREAMQRIVRDLSGAYLSAHVPTNVALRTELTSFTGRGASQYARLDFTSFAHRRTDRDVHESDQAEVGYWVSQDPEVTDKWDLVRREQTPIDLEPLKGGISEVLAEDIQEFTLKYLDPMTGQWLESWDTVQTTGQPNRLPLEVRIRLVLKGVGDGNPYEFATKIFIPIQQPLSFGLPRQ
jgi:general secretion pathway protein J